MSKMSSFAWSHENLSGIQAESQQNPSRNHSRIPAEIIAESQQNRSRISGGIIEQLQLQLQLQRQLQLQGLRFHGVHLIRAWFQKWCVLRAILRALCWASSLHCFACQVRCNMNLINRMMGLLLRVRGFVPTYTWPCPLEELLHSRLH